MPLPAGPLTGPDVGSGLCAAWIQAADVQTRPGCGTIDNTTAGKAALVASELLYALSGRQFSGGGCEATVRPAATPRGMSWAAWAASMGGTFTPGYGTPVYGGVCTVRGAVLDHGGCPQPEEITLGAYPVTAILAVKIDGTTIPPDEYRLQGARTLLRLRTSSAAQPTVRAGWPTHQAVDLPDTEVGTFSVTYSYGQTPPESGIYAAQVLAGEIAQEMIGKATGQLPARVSDLARQGVTIRVGDPLTSLEKGLTGIPAVDRFLISVNPQRLVRRSQVWSPDLGRPRRV